LEVGDPAGLETYATKAGGRCLEISSRFVTILTDSSAKTQPNLFGLRREAKRHAALEALSAVEKRCRRCALPPQSKILSVLEDFDASPCVVEVSETTGAIDLVCPSIENQRIHLMLLNDNIFLPDMVLIQHN
jgi:hypothetical protein